MRATNDLMKRIFKRDCFLKEGVNFRGKEGVNFRGKEEWNFRGEKEGIFSGEKKGFLVGKPMGFLCAEMNIYAKQNGIMNKYPKQRL